MGKATHPKPATAGTGTLVRSLVETNQGLVDELAILLQRLDEALLTAPGTEPPPERIAGHLRTVVEALEAAIERLERLKTPP